MSSSSPFSIGFIGAGNVASRIAKLAVTNNHPVLLSNSRGPESLAPLIATLGPLARAGTTSDACQCDLVVISVPLHAYKAAIPADKLNGKIVLGT